MMSAVRTASCLTRNMFGSVTTAAVAAMAGCQKSGALQALPRATAVVAAAVHSRAHSYSSSSASPSISFPNRRMNSGSGNGLVLGSDTNISSAIAGIIDSKEDVHIEGVQLRQFEGHNLDSLPSNVVDTSRNELLSFFASMYSMRRLELSADVLYKGGLIRGFCHLYDGQEAIVAGTSRSRSMMHVDAPQPKQIEFKLIENVCDYDLIHS